MFCFSWCFFVWEKQHLLWHFAANCLQWAYSSLHSWCFILLLSMRQKFLFVWKHLLLFVGLELVFVFLLFREFPGFWLWSALGVGHTTYRLVVVIAWLLRERLTYVWQRFLATYLPLLFHFVIHLWVGVETLEFAHEHIHQAEDLWLIVWIIGLGVLIFVWEYLLHRTSHCDHHHWRVHKDCDRA